MDALAKLYGQTPALLRYGYERNERAHRVAEHVGTASGSLPQRVRIWIEQELLAYEEAGAPEEQRDHARAVFTSPNLYAFFKGGASYDLTEDQLMKDLRAMARAFRETLREKGFKIGKEPK